MPRVALTRPQCQQALRAVREYLVRNPALMNEYGAVLQTLEDALNRQSKLCRFCSGEMEFVRDAFSVDAEGKPRRPGEPSEVLRFRSAWICISDPAHVEITS